MKLFNGFFVIAGLFPLVAHAQVVCAEQPALLAYQAARQSELPALDAMSDEELGRIENFYEVAWESTINQFYSTELGAGTVDLPMMVNNANIESVLAGDLVYGGLGIYADSTMAFVPASVLLQVSEELEMARASVRGGATTFAEYNDLKYRGQVSQALASVGCPADLSANYGLEPWSSGSH